MRYRPRAGSASSARALLGGAAAAVALSCLTACTAPADGVAVAGTGSAAGTGAASGSSGAASGSSGAASGSARPDASGGSGGGSIHAADSGPSRGPTPARAGIRFPFPQNREAPRCSYPSAYRNDQVVAAYTKWKADMVTANGAGGHLRVQRPNEPSLEHGSTVSEGIGYGMLISVYMGDQTLFDELWKYERLWLDDNGLMDWYINAAGTDRLGTGAATDADEDMAFALVMADRQWGGQGTLDRPYIEYARDQIQRFSEHEIFEGKLARAGDHWGDWNRVNISYFAPSYYRVFAAVDQNHVLWDAVLKTVYDTIDNALNAMNGNQTNGLVPAWCTSEGVPGDPGLYQYDSCRTPFRIGLDWCFSGETRARDYVAKTSRFFAALRADAIADGYDLNGTAHPQTPGGHSAAFIGPAAVGAMSDATYRPFVDDAYPALASGALLAGGAYYEESWTVLSLLMMTGNFLDYTAL
ncbi:MAG TPA: glycosyl hydrolase family 8 [Polyangiaceae bacterium]